MHYARYFCVEKQPPTDSANDVDILPPPPTAAQNCIASLHRGKSFLSLFSVRRLPAPPPVVLSSPALVTAGTKGGPSPCATAAAAEAAAGSEKQKPSLDGARLPSPVPCVLVRPAHLNLPCRSAATSPEICRTGDPRSRRDGPPPALPPPSPSQPNLLRARMATS